MMQTSRRIRLVITDLDNTLYDWVTFFARSFMAMADELAVVLDLPIDEIYRQFKAIHQHYGNSEQPFAVLELPSVRQRFPGADREEIMQALAGPLRAFNSARKKHLQLYSGVLESLQVLHGEGIVLVGHTEAVLANSYYRLNRLGVAPLYRRLYTLMDKHPVDNDRPGFEFHLPDFLMPIPRGERKPNPKLLLDICRREGVLPSEALYVGDSLTRDIGMAKEAGVRAVWARYGTRFDKGLWAVLVQITHWTDEDVAREEVLRHRYDHVVPDDTIDSFAEVLDIVGLHERVRVAARG